jgi:Small-conductance mechanosensitive channel
MNMDTIQEWVNELLTLLGVSADTGSYWDNTIAISVIVGVSFIVDIICRKIVLRIFKHVAKRTVNVLDDLIIERKIIHKLINIIPSILVYILIPLAFPDTQDTTMLKFIQQMCVIYIIAVSLRFINASLDLVYEVSAGKEKLKNKPLKGFIQIIQVVLIVIAIILIVAVLIDKSPKTLFTGLGASAAILTLVFKDTILGFVAGIQLSTNDMLRPGDWVTIEKYGADGMVMEVTIYAIRVRNWDNTITTVPPYALISDAFQNWRPMFESGGRRIKRSVNINMNSIKFCTPEMLERFRKIAYISEYVDSKEEEICKYNKEKEIDPSISVNGRRQTNLGVFRAYLISYLRNHPQINQNMMCMVRQLQPTEKGLPVEVYCFTATTVWVNYEGIQADIFDHILAVLPDFELQVHQEISGCDLRAIRS